MAQDQLQSVLDWQQVDLAWNAIKNAHSIGIVSHRHPDPDTIGSNFSLRETLIGLGKKVQSFCVHQPPHSCDILLQEYYFHSQLNTSGLDLLISVDCGGLDQFAFPFPLENFTGPFINIDHHASNNFYGSINLVNQQLSSTSEIIYLLTRHWNLPISPFMATCLLFGLYYDTGSFMHSNVSPEVLEIASNLVSLGADRQAIIRSLFHNFHLNKYHLWGAIMEKVKVTEEHTAVAVITREQQNSFQTVPEDISGLINYISMVKESQYAVLINQDENNQLKGSLRTSHDTINLSTLAQTLGGGGHRKASGFGFPGNIEKQISWKITS